jgi:hypothetical protein
VEKETNDLTCTLAIKSEKTRRTAGWHRQAGSQAAAREIKIKLAIEKYCD